MRKLVFATATMLLLVSCKASIVQEANSNQKRQTDSDRLAQRIVQIDYIYLDWVVGAQDIARITLNPEAQNFLKVLQNQYYATPTENSGKLFTVKLTEPQDPNVPSIGFVVLNSKELQALPVWLAAANQIQYPCKYEREYIIIDSRYKMLNKRVKGLILLHEMVHWKQDINDSNSERMSKISKELEAWEFQISLLDKLQLPGYETFVQVEVSKMTSDAKWNQKPFISDPRVEDIFGNFASEYEQIRAAKMLQMKIFFQTFEQDPETAIDKKIALLASIYNL